jgi:alkanesulfonate monooxygenase SsuD/methylene tetrahydromethanopterin reductase-like flavin-dependent oxidoreductase (luciferase family)
VTQPFRLGFLTHSEGPGDPRRLYQETLDLFVAADKMGFDTGWLAQHHFQEVVGRLPSLFPFLAAAAQVTQRIRLGTAVIVLPFDNPLRVAEDAAFVDILSGGRLEFGIGSGGSPAEFQAFGVDVGERLNLTTNGVKVIHGALRGEPLGGGELRMQPFAPGLSERVWQSGQTFIGAQHVAQNGMGLLLSRSIIGDGGDDPTDVQQLPVVEAYKAAWQVPNAKPRVGMSRGIYPARDKRTALEELREDVLRTVNLTKGGGRFVRDKTLEDYCKRLHIFYGHPEEIAIGLREDVIFPHATDLILQYAPVIPTQDRALQILEQIATEIAPALGWKPNRSTETDIVEREKAA